MQRPDHRRALPFWIGLNSACRSRQAGAGHPTSETVVESPLTWALERSRDAVEARAQARWPWAKLSEMA
jgi:hypothetical protein